MTLIINIIKCHGHAMCMTQQSDFQILLRKCSIEQALLKMTKVWFINIFVCLDIQSVTDMKFQILEKIYHSSENPVNTQLHRRLGTAAPYGCNDQIKGVGTLSSPSCKRTNVLGIF